MTGLEQLIDSKYTKPKVYKIPIVEMCPEAAALQKLADIQFKQECASIEIECKNKKQTQRKD